MLHEACPETKAVLITGHGSVRTAVTALKRGAVEYMTKPIKPRRLLALIRALTADPPAYLTNRMLANDTHRGAVVRRHARALARDAAGVRDASASPRSRTRRC